MLSGAGGQHFSGICDRIARVLDRQGIIDILQEPDGRVLDDLCRQACAIRKECVGDRVYLRGIIEFSNYCSRDCLYCGLRSSNATMKRYRMSLDEIEACARAARQLELRTIVLQSGEDGVLDIRWLCEMVRRVKALDVAVTVSVGERSFADYRSLKEAGADRYLLKFETSDEALFAKLKPDSSYTERMRCLEWLRQLDYQVGSGIMIGLPGQTPESIADDILLFKELDLDMIGVGPFIAHPDTPLVGTPTVPIEQVLKAVALTRIVTRNAHIPATTATGSIDPAGREKALRAGANVVMPDITPVKYRPMYEIYPGKACVGEQVQDCLPCLVSRIQSAGLEVSFERGDSVKR
jgi:biotin synthase